MHFGLYTVIIVDVPVIVKIIFLEFLYLLIIYFAGIYFLTLYFGHELIIKILFEIFGWKSEDINYL